MSIVTDLASDSFEQLKETGVQTVKKTVKTPSDIAVAAAKSLSSPSVGDSKTDELKEMEANKKQQDNAKIAQVKQKLAVMAGDRNRFLKLHEEERQRLEKIRSQAINPDVEKQKAEKEQAEQSIATPSKPTRGLPFSQKSQNEKNKTVSG